MDTNNLSQEELDDPIVKAQAAKNAVAGGGTQQQAAENNKNNSTDASEEEENVAGSGEGATAPAAEDPDDAIMEKHFGVKDKVFIKSRLDEYENLKAENEKLKKHDPYAGLDEETANRVKYIKAGGTKETFNTWYPLHAEALSAEDAIVMGKLLKIKRQNPKSDITADDIRETVKGKYKIGVDPSEDPSVRGLKLEMEEDASGYREYISDTRKKVLGEFDTNGAAVITPEQISAKRESEWQPVVQKFASESNQIFEKIGTENVAYKVPQPIVDAAIAEVMDFLKLEEIDPDTKNPKDVKVIEDMLKRVIESKASKEARGYFLKKQEKNFLKGKHNPRILETSASTAEIAAKKKTGEGVARQIAESNY